MLILVLISVFVILLSVSWYVTRLVKILCFTLEDFLTDLFNTAWRDPGSLPDFYGRQIWRGKESSRYFPVFRREDLDDLEDL